MNYKYNVNLDSPNCHVVIPIFTIYPQSLNEHELPAHCQGVRCLRTESFGQFGPDLKGIKANIKASYTARRDRWMDEWMDGWIDGWMDG